MVDEKEEKTKSGSSSSGKQTSHKTEINMNDLRCNKKLLKSVNKQLKSLHLMSDSSSDSDNSSDDSENYSTTSGATIKKKKKRLKKCTVSFSDTSSSDTSSSNYTYNTRKGKHVSNSSESDNSSDYECKKRHKKYKKKSGLNVTSKQRTKHPQDCPQSKLQLEYANKKIKFEDLKYNQFVAGEMEIIIACKNDKEKTGRLRLLKKISYYYELYDWKALLQFYAAWIRRIESGQNKWSDDSVDIETPLLAGSVRPKQNKLNKGASNMIKSPVVWFCSDFQKKICSFSGSHDKVVKGVTRHVKHICASCLLKDNKQLPHAESDPSCPHHEL
jgi:hypothetical protein